MSDLRIEPATAERWDDVRSLAGDNGFYSNCWCTWWWLTNTEFSELGGPEKEARLRDEIAAGHEPGLLAYRHGEPVGWVAVAPRERYDRLNRSPKLKPADGTPVWSIVCFVVKAGHRRSGVSKALLEAAVGFARRHGATHVEGYPIDTGGGARASSSLFTGVLATFESAGFVEITRRGGRPIVRRPL